MIYVAVADLIPGLHKRTAIRETLVQVAFIALGIGSIWLIHAGLASRSIEIEFSHGQAHRRTRHRPARRSACASRSRSSRETHAGEGASQQVMTGFAEAYRAWLEAVSRQARRR